MKNPRITSTEIEIIKKAQAGDELAFNTLFNKYKGFVENILFQYIKDMDEAKDIANIVFLKVYNKLSTFTDYSSFGGWLRIITNRTAIDYLREIENKRIVLGSEDERLSSDELKETTEEDLVNQLTYNQLLAEFKKLPESTRKVFELFYKDNLSINEISGALKVPKGTIKSTLSRTRRKIKQSIR
jgi:RNA polymerase sigma-70 factor (ECF subfamily)